MLSLFEEFPGSLSYLLNMYYSKQVRGLSHRWHSDCYFVSSVDFQDMFGRNYKKLVNAAFEVVDNNFSRDKGITKAYQLRPGVLEEMKRLAREHSKLLVQPPKKDTATRKYNNYTQLFCEEAVLKVIQDIESGVFRKVNGARFTEETVIYLHSLLGAAHHKDENGFSVLYQEYEYTGAFKARRFGRGISFQQIPSLIRKRIIKPYRDHLFNTTGKEVVELDMVNAHPNIMRQLISQTAETQALTSYCNDRESHLQEVRDLLGLDRKEAKEILLATTYGCGTSIRPADSIDWSAKDPMKGGPRAREVVYYRLSLARQAMLKKKGWGFLDQYSQAIEAATLQIVNSPAFKDYISTQARTSYMNSQGLVVVSDEAGQLSDKQLVALFIQHEEDKVLRACEEFFAMKDCHVSSLEFDGFRVECHLSSLDGLSGYVLNKTGYDIKFTSLLLD